MARRKYVWAYTKFCKVSFVWAVMLFWRQVPARTELYTGTEGFIASIRWDEWKRLGGPKLSEGVWTRIENPFWSHTAVPESPGRGKDGLHRPVNRRTAVRG